MSFLDNGYVICLKRNDEEIGAIHYIEPISTVHIIKKAKSFIDNYNKNLCGRDIPDPILAHRFFEKENIERNLYNHFFAKILPESKRALNSSYAMYSIPDIIEEDKEYGEMGLVYNDIKNIKNMTISSMDIDIGRNIIVLNSLTRADTITSYCDRLGIDKYKFNVSSLPHYNTNYFHFNEIDETLDFISENEYWQYAKLGFSFVYSIYSAI